MNRSSWTYALVIYAEDGSQLRQSSVEVDWEPATEWLRLQALREGLGQREAFELNCTFEPVWHSKAGAPYVGYFLGRVTAEGRSIEHRFPIDYVRRYADDLSKELVKDGALQEGALFTYRGLAFPEHGRGAAGQTPESSNGRGRLFSSKAIAPATPVLPGVLSEHLTGTDVVGTLDPLDLPVVIPQSVLDETAELAGAAGECETGGILIGHLRQDADEPEAFVEVTAQIPALGAEADSSRLSFTPEVWTAVRAAIDLRGRGEIMVSWWHSHPVHHWCRDCPPDKRQVCPLREDFLSAHDRLLHRTVFPRAYSTALVINELGDGERTFSFFGPREGRLEPRGFHLGLGRVDDQTGTSLAVHGAHGLQED